MLRNLALIGALLLVLAESRNEARSLFAGVPSMGDNKPKNFMQLAGRILLAFMFITLIRFELSFLQVVQDIIGSVLMVLVVGKLYIIQMIDFISATNVILIYSSWLQNKVVSINFSSSLVSSEYISQRMVDYSFI